MATFQKFRAIMVSLRSPIICAQQKSSHHFLEMQTSRPGHIRTRAVSKHFHTSTFVFLARHLGHQNINLCYTSCRFSSHRPAFLSCRRTKLVDFITTWHRFFQSLKFTVDFNHRAPYFFFTQYNL